jgi:hypothetical protein
MDARKSFAVAGVLAVACYPGVNSALLIIDKLSDPTKITEQITILYSYWT